MVFKGVGGCGGTERGGSQRGEPTARGRRDPRGRVGACPGAHWDIGQLAARRPPPFLGGSTGESASPRARAGKTLREGDKATGRFPPWGRGWGRRGARVAPAARAPPPALRPRPGSPPPPGSAPAAAGLRACSRSAVRAPTKSSRAACPRARRVPEPQPAAQPAARRGWRGAARAMEDGRETCHGERRTARGRGAGVARGGPRLRPAFGCLVAAQEPQDPWGA